MNNESFKRDPLTRKILQKAGMEQPSYSFTSKIMEQIRLSRSPEVFIYQPVISRKTWVLLGFIAVTVLFLFMLMPAAQTPYATTFAKYFAPAQDAMGTAVSGFFEKLSLLKSLSWMAFALAAGWLLFGMDKLLRRIKPIH
jgi:hypothetical protein